MIWPMRSTCRVQREMRGKRQDYAYFKGGRISDVNYINLSIDFQEVLK